MNLQREDFIRGVMSGSMKGPRAGILRLALSTAEPFYSGIMRLRNRMFEAGWRKSRRLNRPVISIGNLTTGGTGKTPMVLWLAERLRQENRSVAILSRGYRAQSGEVGDELAMLNRALNQTESSRPIYLAANPDRTAAGTLLLREHPEIDVFLLDDAFQHRRLARDLDIVLINACEPFGFGHVLPRGMLREPAAGLKRADAVVLTHSDRVSDGELQRIENKIRAINPNVPIYHAMHVAEAVLSSDGEQPIESLAGRRLFGFCGIGNPAAFERHLSQGGNRLAGSRRFDDHHAYTPADLDAIEEAAMKVEAELLVTTEKDWVKIESLRGVNRRLNLVRVRMRLAFKDNEAEELFAQVKSVISRP